jgi:signal peptidase I
MPSSILSASPAPAPTSKPRGASRLIRFLIYAGSAIALVILFFLAQFFLWARCFELRAFRVPSASMCPAICENERIIAGMDAFNRRPPQRGEVILFERDEGPTKFIKRVIGVAGDTVTRGPSNTILVNNQPLILPAPCGDNNAYAHLAAEGPRFEPVKVPDGSLFVIGDNLDNSYDSRFFGLVSLDKVRGKALLVYWSLNPSRFACRIN